MVASRRLLVFGVVGLALAGGYSLLGSAGPHPANATVGAAALAERPRLFSLGLAPRVESAVLRPPSLSRAPLDRSPLLASLPGGRTPPVGLPDFHATEFHGAPIRDGMKPGAALFPRVDRRAKGDLRAATLVPRPAHAPRAEASAPPPPPAPRASLTTPTRDPLRVAPVASVPARVRPNLTDGASPAARDPLLAHAGRPARVPGDLEPVTVAAVPVAVTLYDPLPEYQVAPFTEGETDMAEPAKPATTTLTRRRFNVGTDDGVARPLDLPPVAITRAHHCLAVAIYHEARGEPLDGQIAVAQVVINRVRSPYYPNDVCAVVYQNSWRRNACQFSFACDGVPDRETEPDAWRRAQQVAQDVIDARAWLPAVSNATHYHADYVSPRWIRDMVHHETIGRHIFYRVRWWS